ncbi:GSCOCG00009109001-RA-CDS [Cotesia congregata]|nr:GSCOCG00009109001-RA-CDS [Cotesia congregata]
MIDSSHAQGSSGLATALKDRPACVMPVQPNRSLPVLPAPHSPYRAIVSRRTSSVSDSGTSQQMLQNVQGTFTNANSTGSLSSSSSSSASTTSSSSPSSSPSPSPLLSSSFTSSSSATIYGTPQKVRCTLDLDKIGMPNLMKNNELSRKPVINIIQESRSHEKSNQNISRRLGNKRKSDDGIENINTNTGYASSRICAKDTINNYNFIDISKSPERYDTIVADSSGNVDPLSTQIYYTDSNAQKRESGPFKKRRKRKEKKLEEEETKITGQKVVPPLRLKKIQSLQANVSEYQPNNDEERVNQIIERERQECMPKFRYYQPKPPEVPIVPDTRPTSKEHATNYRIVTGQTPPYDERIDSSTMPSKDLQGLLFRKNNHNFKTDKLKQVNSPSKFDKAAFDSCVKQIKKLTNLLEMLPEVSPEAAKDNVENTVQIMNSVKTNDLPNLNASPPSSTTFTDLLPSLNNSPSPEPPKLSPKTSVDFEATEERNSPPLLPRATSSNGENYDDWEGSGYHKQINSNYNDNESEFNSSVNSSIITTTTGSIVTEQIDIDDKPEYLDLSTNLTKSETFVDAVSNKITKELSRIEVDCDTEQVLKIDLRNSLRPENMVIDTTSLSKYEKESDAEYSPENRLRIDESEELQEVQHKEPVGGATIKVVDNLTSAAAAARTAVATAAITSSCDIFNNQPSKGKSKLKDRRVAESPKSNIIINEQQFPSFGNWVAKISTKLPNHQLSRLITDKNTRPNSAISVTNEVPSFSHYYHYYPQLQQHQEAAKIPASPGLKHKNGLEASSKTLTAEPQLKNQTWEPAEQPSQSQLLQSNSTSNISTSLLETQLQQKPQQIDPQLYPSAQMNKLLARNYSVDPYRVPLLRPTSQLPDPLSTNSIPYHSSASPLLNSLSMSPSSPLSYWHQTIGKTHPESKRGFTDIPLNYDPISLAKRSAYSQYHSLLPTVPINLMNPSYQIPQQRQQQPQQHPSPYDRLWDKSGHCLRPPDSPIPALNYSPWQSALFPPESLLPGRSYLNSNWTADPRNLLSTITPAMQNFASPYQSISVPRVRNIKDRPEQVRNCETPHLGKVDYSPNTARTFQCSNCGSRGPVYKCLGCEAAYYCNETCQARHWNCHVATCPKKMPKLKKVVP